MGEGAEGRWARMRDVGSGVWGGGRATEEELGLAPSREGRKKGAFSGALGGAVGLLRAAIVSRCSSDCQRERGTRLSVVRAAVSCAVCAERTSSLSASASEGSSSNAAARSPSPPSPEAVGRMAGRMSPSAMCRVGTCVNSVRLVQMAMPTLSASAVARNSPVGEKASAVQG